MRTRIARNVIVGAGAMGSAAAYHLAGRGEPVVLVEQFGLGHDRGSSHGAARIIRHSYADPAYARLMVDAFRAWKVLEADAGRTLYYRAGGVSIAPGSIDYVERVAASLAAIDVPHRRMTGTEWNRFSPTFGLKATDDVVFEPDAGMLAASDAVALQLELARRDGAEVIEGSPVLRIDLEAGRPRLVFADEVLEAERLIVTAGAWTGSLIPSLASTLRPTRQQVLYFRPPDRDAYALGRFPAFIYKGEGDLDSFYGMPEALGMGVKVARHGGPDVDPALLGRTIEDDYVAEVREFLERSDRKSVV